MIVPTSSVKVAAGYEPSDREVRKVVPFLLVQGLIEPMKLNHNGEIGPIDPWDPARLVAAKQLGWATVIVAYP